jgi:hypothetical protein
MILGMTTFTFVHVALSLIGILSGLLVVLGMMSAKQMDGLTAIFLATTVLTSVTGFLFPYHGFTPGIGVGIVSMAVLALAIVARYLRHLEGGWRRVYVIAAVMALYFNVFVFVVQSFEKSPTLKALAPTQTEPPFKIAQGVVLVSFIALGILAAKKFKSA